MPTNRTPIQRRRQMSFSEEMALEFGDSPPTTFATDQERRAAWEQHRDYLMAKCDRGWRPAAWWDYDAPRLGVRRPRDPEYEKAALWEAGLLTPEEKATLERDWRQHFDEANSPDYFGHCIGYDKARHCAVWAKGEEARKAHYKWAGIPRALIKRWAEERERPAPQARRAAKSNGGLPDQPPPAA